MATSYLFEPPRDLSGEGQCSSDAPSLKGGQSSIEVKQITMPEPVASRNRKERRGNSIISPQEQSFNVDASKFNLPAGIVDSICPAPGGTAEVNVLPHIVLKDPHLPWGREIKHALPESLVDASEDGRPQDRTPWLALLAFTPDELKLEQEDIDCALVKFPQEFEREQGEKLEIRMRACDTTLLSGVESVVNAVSFDPKLDARDAAQALEVVLVPKNLFVSLFTEPDNGGVPDFARYKLLAHVRQHVKDSRTATGGAADSNLDEAKSSIVLSHRTGAIGASVPTTTVVHLVSLDLRDGLSMPLPDKATRVAMVSLYSWTYTTRPSSDYTNYSPLARFGERLTILQPRIPEELDEENTNNRAEGTAITELIARRQANGYTLVRHRTVTGEVMAAIMRGPLVPTFVAHPLHEGFLTQSNFGSDLQILDPDTSLMDLTYASAWQLGKTLAMGDETFSSALARLRREIHAEAFDGAKRGVRVGTGKAQGSRREAATSMQDLLEGLKGLNLELNAEEHRSTNADVNRWNHPDEVETREVVGMPQQSPNISSRRNNHIDVAATLFALADDDMPYNQQNVPRNKDSAYVLSWILEKLHLADVPAHYLLPDASHLPEETLRLFFIDENWTDALIDGALSLANLWGAKPDEDTSRIAIKTAINKILYEPDAKPGHVRTPKFGFMLRSQLLSQFPDLSVEVGFDKRSSNTFDSSGDGPQPSQTPVLVQKRLSPETMYCLLDSVPSGSLAVSLRLPPNQPYFTIGQSLTNDALGVSFRRICTATEAKQSSQSRLPLEYFKPGIKPAMFDWALRTLSVAAFVKHQQEVLKNAMEGKLENGYSNSALLALQLQLNEPIMELDISNPNAYSPLKLVPFQLSVSAIPLDVRRE